MIRSTEEKTWIVLAMIWLIAGQVGINKLDIMDENFL